MPDIPHRMVTLLNLPPMFEDGNDPGTTTTTSTSEQLATDILTRNWRDLRALRSRYFSHARHAEVFDLFSLAWKLYDLYDSVCAHLSMFGQDYGDLNRLASISSRLSPSEVIIAHCWCAAVARFDDHQSVSEFESQLKDIPRLPPSPDEKDGITLSATAFRALLESSAKVEKPSWLMAAYTIETEIMNRGHLCAEIRALHVDRADTDSVHDMLTRARDRFAEVGLWKQFASVDKMLGMQEIFRGDGAAASRRYAALARTAEAQGLGPVYVFDAQRRAYVVTQSLKIAGFNARELDAPIGAVVAVERPEITWYEGFRRQFPEYDLEGDRFSITATLSKHYGVLNNTEKERALVYEMMEFFPYISPFLSRIGRDKVELAIDGTMRAMGSGRWDSAPPIFTPAMYEEVLASLPLNPEFVRAMRSLILDMSAMMPADIVEGMLQHIPEEELVLPVMRHQIRALGVLIGAAVGVDGSMPSLSIDEVENLERLTEKAHNHR
ncbi:hypothetical protein QBC47DRAFT_435928 [Echria macrotheca]|uniref:Uncharacterized protein n=1 Tax=Echria macrotheca TaxID=438768 RepID=A0AAJ0BIE5_9PEZI|nr:hypothetical protein QBC47DRAFT_435928 [Echria macrotheca]